MKFLFNRIPNISRKKVLLCWRNVFSFILGRRLTDFFSKIEGSGNVFLGKDVENEVRARKWHFCVPVLGAFGGVKNVKTETVDNRSVINLNDLYLYKMCWN